MNLLQLKDGGLIELYVLLLLELVLHSLLLHFAELFLVLLVIIVL